MKAAAVSLIVLTLNAAGPRRVHQGWPTRREAIVSRLKTEAADAAAFQEVWRRQDLEALAAGAGHSHQALAAELGVALTSRVPISSSKSLGLGGGYGVLRARISQSGRELDLYSARLEGGEGAAARRMGQLFRLAEFVRRESAARPFALLGDLEASPDDREMRLFMDLLELRDLCVRHGDEVCGRTLDERRVDYILIPYSSAAPGRRARAAFNDPLPSQDEPSALSSHFGLRADLDTSLLSLHPAPVPAGRIEALAEVEGIVERARDDAARQAARTGWWPLIGARRSVLARGQVEALTALLEEVRSASIRARRDK